MHSRSLNKIIVVSVFLNVQGKNKLLTYVVAAGVTYGAEENMLHYLFKVCDSYNI